MGVRFLLMMGLVVFFMWLERRIGIGRMAIRTEGLACYEGGSEVFVIPWTSVKQVKLFGGKSRGWGILIRSRGHLPRVLPCRMEKDKADALFKHANKLWENGRSVDQ